jgi:hypothetical protein
MFDVDSGIDHGNRDVDAASQGMGLGQSQLGERVLRGIALGQYNGMVLQQIAEIRLHRVNAGLGGEFAACGLDRAAAGDAEQPDGGAHQRKILRLQARKAVTPRQFVGLRVGQRAIDLGHNFVGDAARVERGLCHVTARTVALVLARRDAPAAIRRHRLTGASAVAVAIGVAAGRACPQVGCGSADSRDRRACHVRIDPRCHRGHGRNARPDVEIGRAHDALRLTAAPSKYANGNAATVSANTACRALLHRLAPSWTMKPQAFALAIKRRAAYGVTTARLTIFSPCSLLIRLTTSSFGIALLPNCSRNRPPLVSTIEA